jgi:hypothetical protein
LVNVSQLINRTKVLRTVEELQFPVQVADWLMKGGHGDNEDDVDIDSETGEKYTCISPQKTALKVR